MSRVLDHLSRLFVEPQAVASEPENSEVQWLPPGSPASTAGNRRAAQRIGVVCVAREARVAGGAAALALAHSSGASCVTVLDWIGAGAPGGRDRPASPASRRCAAQLRDQGHVVTSAGRVVRVGLPETEEEAAAAARAVLARTDGPGVVVVAAARGPATERLLTDLDLILLVVRPGADADLTSIALAALRALAPSQVVELPNSPAACALARSGSALVAPLRAPLVVALGSGK